MNSNNSAPINESLGFLVVKDPNLSIILNDFDVTQPIKNLIIQMSTDKLFISKLSNAVQPDDFKVLGKITYDKNKKELVNRYTVMLEIFKVRGMKNDDIIRLKSYLSYLKKKF
jgi:hypothetical protein